MLLGPDRGVNAPVKGLGLGVKTGTVAGPGSWSADGNEAPGRANRSSEDREALERKREADVVPEAAASAQATASWRGTFWRAASMPYSGSLNRWIYGRLKELQ